MATTTETHQLWQASEDASRLVFNTSVFSPEYQDRKAASAAAFDAYIASLNRDRVARGDQPISAFVF